MKNKRELLFTDEDVTFWKKEWQGMPEFVQEDLTPYQSIWVHFTNKEDMDAFSKLVGQKITMKTRFMYYPKVEWQLRTKKYVDEKDPD